ncbi:uncharacterized protein TNCV_5047331 [Trichonephila clavipes]|nr:uncharacterized protein TNCV_5047331 [Trichonephila clavipes]
MGCLNTIPVLLQEELITHLYYPLQSECGEKFISEASTAVISFSPYSVSKRAKHHLALPMKHMTATAGLDVIQSGRPIFDDFFQHLWPYIGNNAANVVFQMVKRLWLIRIDQ